ncbi:MAG: hypothetical protein HY391_06805, partial [Deltaproteobacteria bacterium]|nr:hypothetical protein [Deltaproteobacteria bacterium]
MEYVVSGPTVILTSTLWFCIILFASYGMGSTFLKNYFSRDNGPVCSLHAIFSLSLGLFSFSFWTFIIGSVGLLKLPCLLLFLLGGTALGLLDLRKHGTDNVRIFKDGFPLSLSDKLLIALFLVLSFLTYLGAHAPATGNDALAYHLYFPKLYAERGALFFTPYHPRSLWPFMMEMLFTAGMLLQGTALAQLLSWSTAILTALAVPAAAAYFSLEKNVIRSAALLIICVPAIWMQSMDAYVDNAMMLYTFLSFIALWIWKERNYSLHSGFIAGLFLSALVSIKYFTLFPALILTLLFGLPLLSKLKKIDHPILAVSLPAFTILLFSSFWFIRSWYYTGNP